MRHPSPKFPTENRDVIGEKPAHPESSGFGAAIVISLLALMSATSCSKQEDNTLLQLRIQALEEYMNLEPVLPMNGFMAHVLSPAEASLNWHAKGDETYLPTPGQFIWQD